MGHQPTIGGLHSNIPIGYRCHTMLAKMRLTCTAMSKGSRKLSHVMTQSMRAALYMLLSLGTGRATDSPNAILRQSNINRLTMCITFTAMRALCRLV